MGNTRTVCMYVCMYILNRVSNKQTTIIIIICRVYLLQKPKAIDEKI